MVKRTKNRKHSRFGSARGKTKKNAILEGVTYAVMSGAGYTFVIPFAVALGIPNFVIGLIAAFSTLAASLGQYLGAWAMHLQKSRRDFGVITRYVQAALWIPFVLLFLLPTDIASFAFVILYGSIIFSGSFSSSAWTSLLGDALTNKERAAYLGHRNRLMGIVDLAASLLAGGVLFLFTNNIFIGFVTIFTVASVFRFISVKYASRVWDPPFRRVKESLASVIKIPKDPRFRNYLILWSGVRFASDLAGPFFAVYMLRNLGFGYLSFGIVIAGWAIGNILAQPHWGKLIDRYGTRPVVFITTALNPLIPAAFLFVSEPVGALVVYFFGGILWAGLNLSVSNFLFRVSSRKNLPDYASSLRGAGAIAGFLGAAIGSFLALSLEGTTIFFVGGLGLIFILSAILRLAVAAYTLRKISPGMKIGAADLMWKLTTVYSVRGLEHEFSNMHTMVAHATHLIHRMHTPRRRRYK